MIHDADSLDKFRPIALSNFKFKIISKIVADCLASFMPILISKEQNGFIRGRNIKDCICLALEAFNTLDKKSFGGNLAIKLDVNKAFDTLDWSFCARSFGCFDFYPKFLNWISIILNYTSISVMVNDSLNGYFKCAREVRKEDSLSPLLFLLAEEVLSRGLSKVVVNGTLKLMIGSQIYLFHLTLFMATIFLSFSKVPSLTLLPSFLVSLTTFWVSRAFAKVPSCCTISMFPF